MKNHTKVNPFLWSLLFIPLVLGVLLHLITTPFRKSPEEKVEKSPPSQ